VKSILRTHNYTKSDGGLANANEAAAPRTQAGGVRKPLRFRLAHAILWVPGTQLFAHVDNLADVISVVGTDVREDLSVPF